MPLRYALSSLSRAFPVLLLLQAGLSAATTQKHYYAHDAVEDQHGVIAPWYKGQNGQLDWRVRIAAETLKRYPWVQPPQAAAPAPAYVYTGAWKIDKDGRITLPPLNDWANGDWGQRAAYVLTGFIDYYRYSGDPAAIAHVTYQADVLLNHCVTPDDHPWPRFPVSVPIKGKPHQNCDPAGMIQLDIVAEIGIPMIRAAQLTHNQKYVDAVRHWGDLFAKHCNRTPGMPPWNRYANPESAPWSEDQQTGGVVFILAFLEELIRTGYVGDNGAILEARDIGRAYLRDVLLPKWTVNDTWGRNYWDWPDFVQAENVTEFAVRYLMENPEAFPNWKTDARNILTLFLNHTSVDPKSGGNVYSGAWAYPESSGCCGRSLWYGPMELVNNYAQYAVLTGSEWAREMARRQMILATYDAHETGVVEDNIDGGPIVAGDWFKIAHPMALKHCLAAIAWMPEVFAPPRENHIVRSTSVVTDVRYNYNDAQVFYCTVDAPAPLVEVLRLSFAPTAVIAHGTSLPRRPIKDGNGYQVDTLPNGDCIVEVRHDGLSDVVIGDNGSQPTMRAQASGKWSRPKTQYRLTRVKPETGEKSEEEYEAEDDCQTSVANELLTFEFVGNQVRLLGSARPDGGPAKLYLDGDACPVEIDCWNPQPRHDQVLYYRNGLESKRHTLKVVVLGKKNPYSGGTNVYIKGIQYSSSVAESVFGEGGGPTDPQRMIFGYTGRTDYVDSRGHAWRPGTEFIVRTGGMTDSVEKSWWTERRRLQITGTDNPELYRYGIHAHEFNVHVTVGPGTYYARLKFAETRNIDAKLRTVTVHVNGQEAISNMDIAATAGGMYKATNIVLNDIRPKNGVIDLRFTGPPSGEAILQALEVGPGDGGQGAKPASLAPTTKPAPSPDGNLLTNGGFEAGIPGDLGSLGKRGGGNGWQYVFAGPTISYIWAESAYSIHPDWGLPVFHSGKEALRTHTEGNGHTTVYQDVEVKPETAYVASVWVQAVDLHGKGFGGNPSDSAGLWIQELDSKGQIVKDHGKKAVTKAGDYQKLTIPLTTAKGTASVRFMLDAVIACPYPEGHVTYDECMLNPR